MKKATSTFYRATGFFFMTIGIASALCLCSTMRQWMSGHTLLVRWSSLPWFPTCLYTWSLAVCTSRRIWLTDGCKILTKVDSTKFPAKIRIFNSPKQISASTTQTNCLTTYLKLGISWNGTIRSENLKHRPFVTIILTTTQALSRNWTTTYTTWSVYSLAHRLYLISKSTLPIQVYLTQWISLRCVMCAQQAITLLPEYLT